MNFYARGFNLYLLGLVFSLAAAVGCQSDSAKKKDTHLAMLRVHVENRAQLLGSGKTISVLRSQPVLVTINAEPALTEASIVNASLLDTPGGSALAIQFDESGTFTLEQYTAAYTGKHFAIFGQWGETAAESRWLAAPLIIHRIGDGLLSFTPDCSPAEAKKLVVGLNNMAKQIASGKMK